MKTSTLAVVGLASVVASGCGATRLQSQFPEYEAPTFADVIGGLTTPKRKTPPPAIVAVGEDATSLLVYNLDGTLRWERDINAQSAPALAGDMVLIKQSDGIVARSLKDGEIRFDLDEDYELVGADGDGEWSAVTVQRSDSTALVLGIHHGDVVWEREVGGGVGAPAVANGHVLVPWATLRVSVLNAASGEEVVRMRRTDAVVGHVLVDGGGLFMGQHGLFRITDQLEDAELGGVHHYQPEKRKLPGQPAFLRDGYSALSEPQSARHRVRLDWRIDPEAREPAALLHDTLYMHYYGLLFALAPKSDDVRWLHTNAEEPWVGTRVVQDGVYAVDASGEVLFLNTDGHPTASLRLERRLSVALVHAPEAGGREAFEILQSEKRSLRDQLLEAAALDDDQLALGRAFAVRHLAREPGANMTRELVGLCGAKGQNPVVREAACQQIGEREAGASYVLKALRQKASYSDKTTAPPVGALARAALRMKIRRAAPLLQQHLQDPATPTAELTALLQALAEFKHTPAAGSIERFLRMHHAEPAVGGMGEALQAAAHALMVLRGDDAELAVRMLAQDGLADAAVRKHLEDAITVRREQKDAEAREALAKAEAAKKPEPQQPKPVAKADTRPAVMNNRLVARVLREERTSLQQCVRSKAPSVRVGRISMVISGAGSVEKLFVTPQLAEDCVQELIQKASFPETRGGRQQVVYVVDTQQDPRPARKQRKRLAPLKAPGAKKKKKQK